MKGRPLHIIVLAVVGLAALAARASGVIYETPGAFGTGLEQPAGTTQRQYSLTARIKLLLFWVGQERVGGARISWTEEPSGGKGLELLIGSDPARAPRKINRWGYVSERVTGSSAELLGVMTQSDEQSIQQAEARINQPGRMHPYRAIRSRLSGGRLESTVVQLFLAEELSYRDLDALLPRIPDSGGVTRGTRVPDGCAPGFLFAVKSLVHESVVGVRAGRPAASLEKRLVSYPYNGSIFELRVQSSRALRETVVDGVPYRTLLESDFEIRNTVTGTTNSFSVTYGTEGPLAEVPVRIIYRPRWWFEAELVLDGSGARRSAASVLSASKEGIR